MATMEQLLREDRPVGCYFLTRRGCVGRIEMKIGGYYVASFNHDLAPRSCGQTLVKIPNDAFDFRDFFENDAEVIAELKQNGVDVFDTRKFSEPYFFLSDHEGEPTTWIHHVDVSDSETAAMR